MRSRPIEHPIFCFNTNNKLDEVSDSKDENQAGSRGDRTDDDTS